MFTSMCLEHHHGLATVARPRVNVRTASAISGSWDFATKPYGIRRPSGAPPG